MKNMAIFALCLISSFASASDMEEVVVKARQIRIVLHHIADNHKQNPITGNWYYVKEVQQKQEDKPKN